MGSLACIFWLLGELRVKIFTLVGVPGTANMLRWTGSPPLCICSNIRLRERLFTETKTSDQARKQGQQSTA